MSTLAICYQDVLDAAKRIEGSAHRTPVLQSSTANALTGAELFFKAENFQRMGAFKFRGAYNAISRLNDAQRRAGVLTFSSGNHAQAIALAAKLQGVRATILMPEDSPAIKVAATQGYGAEVIRFNRYTDDREALAQQLSDERGLVLIPPYDHADVIAGQGTAAKELFDDVGELDVLFVCLGGGGLLAGCASVAHALSPDCEVYGVEPELGNDGQQSLHRGEIVKIQPPKTIADGAATPALGKLTFPIIQAYVKDILTVSDDELAETMQFFASRMKIVVEPTGCLGAAAAFKQRVDIRGKRVGVILSGGNVDLDNFCRLI